MSNTTNVERLNKNLEPHLFKILTTNSRNSNSNVLTHSVQTSLSDNTILIGTSFVIKEKKGTIYVTYHKHIAGNNCNISIAINIPQCEL